MFSLYPLSLCGCSLRECCVGSHRWSRVPVAGGRYNVFQHTSTLSSNKLYALALGVMGIRRGATSGCVWLTCVWVGRRCIACVFCRFVFGGHTGSVVTSDLRVLNIAAPGLMMQQITRQLAPSTGMCCVCVCGGG